MVITEVTEYGQIKEGYMLLIEKKNGVVFPCVALDVIMRGSDKEEIRFNKKRNLYFIMSMMLDGSSWVKSCKIVEQGKIYCITNNMVGWVS